VGLCFKFHVHARIAFLLLALVLVRAGIGPFLLGFLLAFLLELRQFLIVFSK
jgi:hypothetical protein